MSNKLDALADIQFVDASEKTVISKIFALYKNTTGRTPAQGDPIRLFLFVIANIVILLLNNINETGKQNLLKYATNTSLDHLGAHVSVTRNDATAANTTIEFTLSAERKVSTTIPEGTRVSNGSNIVFVTKEALTISAGAIKGIVGSTCTLVGEVGNGYIAGEISTIVDPIPYVMSATNTTKTEGGSDVEDDEHFRDRIEEAPEKFSCAGSTGAYKYYAKTASSLITDVAVISPTPGNVVIYPLLSGGVIPGEEILKSVLEICSDEYVRPLTDNVSSVAPNKVEFDVNLTYYINKSDSTSQSTIKREVEAAVQEYMLWQRSELGRDINRSELIKRVMDAGAKRVEVVSPVFTKVKNGSKTDNYIVEVAIANNSTVNYGGIEDE